MNDVRILAPMLRVLIIWCVAITSAASAPMKESVYDRKAFGSWLDVDRDCLNTRHELLLQLSTATAQKSSSGCSITRGRWADPYTGKVFFDPRKLDVDHLVPLAYAWRHGADQWPDEKRKVFANDPRNLMVVEASVNRQKGARGLTEWLPPNEGFHCQYVLRFLRVFRIYGLEFTKVEARQVDALKRKLCSAPVLSG